MSPAHVFSSMDRIQNWITVMVPIPINLKGAGVHCRESDELEFRPYSDPANPNIDFHYKISSIVISYWIKTSIWKISVDFYFDYTWHFPMISNCTWTSKFPFDLKRSRCLWIPFLLSVGFKFPSTLLVGLPLPFGHEFPSSSPLTKIVLI